MRSSKIFLFVVVLFGVLGTPAQSTGFSYQGSLKNADTPATGNYDFEFALFDAASGGAQQGGTVQRLNVAVAGGVFSVSLDFGTQFPGANRFLEIRVRAAGGGAFTTLTPREQIKTVPYAVKSLNSEQLGGVTASEYVVTTDPRMTDARNPLAGSVNYIQNTNTIQTGSNFNVSGVGRAGTLRSATIDSLGEYQMFGTRILRVTGDNTSLGPNAGDSSVGTFNTYLGAAAGRDATSNTMQNTFAGTNSGVNNANGSRNSFFGARSGLSNNGGGSNTFVGEGSGVFSQSGGENSFFGADSGQSNSSGSRNSYFGVWSGGLPTVTDSTAIGYRAFATQNNTLILGSVGGFNGAGTSPNVGIGTVAPTERLHVVGNGLFSGNLSASGIGTANVFNATTQYNIGNIRVLSASGTENIFVGANAGAVNSGGGNAFFGFAAGQFNTSGGGNSIFGNRAGSHPSALFLTGNFNSFFGHKAGERTLDGALNTFIGTGSGNLNESGNSNTFVGHDSGNSNTSGSFNTVVGENADVSPGLSNATAIGSKAYVGSSNSIVLGSINGVNGATADTRVGIGTTSPLYKLEVNTPSEFGLRVQANFPGGHVASFGGTGRFGVDAPGVVNGRLSILENGNVGIGIGSPTKKLHIVGEDVRVQSPNAATLPRFSLHFTGGGADVGKWQNYAQGSAAGGTLTFSALNDAENAQTEWLRVNRSPGINITNVIFPAGTIFIENELRVTGATVVNTLGAAGATQLCRNDLNQISTCSSSLRYKTNIGAFAPGLSFVNQLRPISFDWKTDGTRDVGFGAEDMAKIDSRFVTYNSAGEVEGVKYDRLSVAFVNAFKEQQEQIESQQKKIDRQQDEIAELKAIVCSIKPDAKTCMPK